MPIISKTHIKDGKRAYERIKDLEDAGAEILMIIYNQRDNCHIEEPQLSAGEIRQIISNLKHLLRIKEAH
jgi:hypothetical protein